MIKDIDLAATGTTWDPVARGRPALIEGDAAAGPRPLLSSRARSVILRAIVALGFCVAVVALSRFPFDDAFIHMRIARNLAFAGQPFFNLGERVMSGSSPLWMVLVAALFRVAGRPSPSLVVGLESVVVVALWVATESWLATTTGRRSLLTAAVAALVVAGLALPSAGFLMESPLALLLAVAGVLALTRERPGLAGAAFALAAATRYEMWLLALVAWLATPGLRARGRFLLLFAPVCFTECAFLWSWYGTLVPHTVRAKALAYPLTSGQFLSSVPGFPFVAQTVTALSWIVGAGACSVIALRGSAGAPAAHRSRRRTIAILGGFSAVLFVAYAARRTFMFPWYWPNVTFPAALAAMGLLVEQATDRRQPDRRADDRASKSVRYAAVGLVGLAMAPALARAANSITNALLNRPSGSGTLLQSLRTQTYLTVGRELLRDCPNGVLLTSEIGAIGWTYRAKIVDGLGLASPEVLRYHPMRVPEQRSSETIGAIPAFAVAELRPDLVVGMETFMQDFLQQRTRLPALADYRLVEQRPAIVDRGGLVSLWDSTSVMIFTRSGACSRRSP
jgi:hypothetical protein